MGTPCTELAGHQEPMHGEWEDGAEGCRCFPASSLQQSKVLRLLALIKGPKLEMMRQSQNPLERWIEPCGLKELRSGFQLFQLEDSRVGAVQGLQWIVSHPE